MNKTLHAIWFKKDNYTIDTANQWLKKHGYHPLKQGHETENFYKYRIRNPSKYGSYYSKYINPYILFIFQN